MALGPTLTLIKEELRDLARDYLGVEDNPVIPEPEPYRLVTRTEALSSGWGDGTPPDTSVPIGASEVLVAVYLEKQSGGWWKRFTPLYNRTENSTWIGVALPDGESTGSTWRYVLVVLQPTEAPAA